ncbi:MAG TPA: hypothetical protein VGY53_07530 [Isosphaeraceae bacterium]|nr:hypothetical protein [Isosphaeraceae bacterium]
MHTPLASATSQVGRLLPEQLIDLWHKVTRAITKYGFAIELCPLEAPKTGIFNGLKISVDPAVEFENQCFILVHLFGHSVQWVAPSLEPSLHGLRHTDDRDHFMQALHDYEFAAASYGLQLLHEAGVTDLDQWFSDFVETDWRYVERYYKTGVIASLQDCLAGGCRLIKPTPIPPLVHRQVEVRFAF